MSMSTIPIDERPLRTRSVARTAEHRKRWSVTVAVLASVALAIGCTGFLGWVLDVDALKRVHPAFVTMKFNTALCLMLSAVSVLLVRRKGAPAPRRLMSRVCASVVAAVGLATLLEHLFHVDLGIDQLFFRETALQAGRSFPGRMGVAASLNFLFLGVALLTLDKKLFGAYRSNALALWAGAVTMLVFLYYFYGVNEFEPIAMYATIAIHTVVAFFCLCAAVLLVRPSRGISACLTDGKAGSAMVRRMLPAALFAPMVLGGLRTFGRSHDLFSPGFGTAAFVLAIITLFVALIVRTAASLNREEEERLRTLEDLRRTASQLAESNRELEQFAYVASHDLQEPLRKVIAYSERLNGADGPTAKEFAEKVNKSAYRMQTVIEDLLRFSRLESEDLRKEPTDLGGLVQEVLSDLERLIAQTGARITVAPLPVATIDRSRMRHLVQNLIINSLKFARAGVPPRVSVEGRVSGSAVELRFDDNGIGFEEKYAEVIFQPFKRLHSKQLYEGSGIGLAISRKIAEQHGGTLTASGRPGEGATFLLRLPV